MFCYGKHAVLQAPCRSLITGQSGLLHICRNCGFASYKLLPQKYNRLGKAASIDKAVKIIQEYVDTLKLNEYLFKFRESKWKYKPEEPTTNLAPDFGTIKHEGNDITCGFTSNFIKGNALFLNNRESYIPRFRYHDGKLYICRLKIVQTTWKNGKGIKSEDAKLVSNISDLQNKGNWLIDKLRGLVQAPEQELWDTFVKEENLDEDWN